MPTIEILVERDPDSCDVVTVFVDGVRTDEYAEHVVDPGAGHLLSEWRESTEWVRTKSGYSPAYVEAIIKARDEAEDSSYIVTDIDEED